MYWVCVKNESCEVGADFPGKLVFGWGFWESGVSEMGLLGSSGCEERVFGLLIERRVK